MQPGCGLEIQGSDHLLYCPVINFQTWATVSCDELIKLILTNNTKHKIGSKQWRGGVTEVQLGETVHTWELRHVEQKNLLL